MKKINKLKLKNSKIDKQELNNLIKWAENEIAEWKEFLKLLKSKLNQT